MKGFTKDFVKFFAFLEVITLTLTTEVLRCRFVEVAKRCDCNARYLYTLQGVGEYPVRHSELLLSDYYSLCIRIFEYLSISRVFLPTSVSLLTGSFEIFVAIAMKISTSPT